ncbi:uncharacterized protein CMU_043180 [Cryptosporidium muris RN66]|uniref:SDE2-like domain-containing protein n=1 Tax=Cryptosporidium muris (strain RN66) TaxID=441375 RepID=B6AAK3_CRYMR|nr:uncharacterized protein CMU_043180 [Cryptosporidium muris RN66]EEA05244.1 hypothetical protein, conserved [Cryptosporidium muris RN66]|eukprot:XP_002139593.1 hypothetical protein [Cryptosporidium muris RN66]
MYLHICYNGNLRSFEYEEFDQRTISAEKLKNFVGKKVQNQDEYFYLLLNGKPITKDSIELCNLFGKVIQVVVGRLMGGKGGFGATIKSQKRKINKKNLNIDSCRDFATGKRIFNIHIEEEIKKWNEKSSLVTDSSVNNSCRSENDTNEEIGELDNNMSYFETHGIKLVNRYDNIQDAIESGFKKLNKISTQDTENIWTNYYIDYTIEQ